MIKIAGKIITPDNIENQSDLDPVQNKILDILHNSDYTYQYSSLEDLKFELILRLNIINASKSLYKSGMDFRVFRESKCNEKFWSRTEEGGFKLKEEVKPSDAIDDIFNNGRKYGTECATAIVIIYYKAVLEIYPEELFNMMFSNIVLMNWHYIDSDLDVRNYIDIADYLPGDCRYFKNPDVDPATPEWQGENAIDLGNGKYYGHGIGIKTGEEIIEDLNENRKEDATQSAYLMESATRPNINYLSYRYYSYIDNN